MNSYLIEIMFPLRKLKRKHNKYFIDILESNMIGRKIICRKWVGSLRVDLSEQKLERNEV